jgi:hypothetical protein
MKNTSSAVIYGGIAGVAGFAIGKYLVKKGNHWTYGLAIAGLVIGGIVGNNS